jgi:hypothetical protein
MGIYGGIFVVLQVQIKGASSTLGHSVGFSPGLENPRVSHYSPTQTGAAGHSGNGLLYKMKYMELVIL